MTRPVCSALILPLLLVLSASAFASSGELLNFQGLGNLQQVNNFYNGSGMAGTPDYGVSFSNNFYGLRSTAGNGGGAFAPTPLGTPAIFLCPGGPPYCGGSSTMGVMNVSAGFSSGLDFYYSIMPGQSLTVTVWSGANGTGIVLGTLSLSATACANNAYYCSWSSIGTSFSGTAHSVTFSGPINHFGLTDITLGSSTTAIPEPSSIYLLAIGGAGISLGALRRFVRS